jgi:hypothetical protein
VSTSDMLDDGPFAGLNGDFVRSFSLYAPKFPFLSWELSSESTFRTIVYFTRILTKVICL